MGGADGAHGGGDPLTAGARPAAAGVPATPERRTGAGLTAPAARGDGGVAGGGLDGSSTGPAGAAAASAAPDARLAMAVAVKTRVGDAMLKLPAPLE